MAGATTRESPGGAFGCRCGPDSRWHNDPPWWSLVAVTNVNELQPPYNLALSQAWLWGKAAMVPTARLLGDGSGLPDALLLMVALRNVHRAATMAQDSLQKPEANQRLVDALAAFDAALPGLIEARDVVEHFDEYRIGDGRVQRALLKQGTSPEVTAAELAEQYAPRLEGSYDEPILRVGPHSIEVTKVHEAVNVLFEGIWAAARAEDGRESE
jgi:hypothetical protein